MEVAVGGSVSVTVGDCSVADVAEGVNVGAMVRVAGGAFVISVWGNKGAVA